jgi:hypothetical protein
VNGQGIVLSMCDRTGVMVQPWLDVGYECWIVDMQHGPGVHRDGRLVRVGGDVTRWLPPRCEYRIVFGFPPCTNLATSGARWFRDKGLAGLADGLAVVEAVADRCEWSGAPWMLENPNGTLSTYWRQPDHRFDPCDFGGWVDGDAYRKRTCLWTGGGFVMPPHRPVEPLLGSLMHTLPPSPDRGDLRSVTPAGFARAVFEANENGVTAEVDGLFAPERAS